MKKLMTAFAACFFAGLVTADPVTSQNIVGYQTLTAPGQFFSSGSTFVSVGSATGEWTLGDVTAAGMVPGDDIIQFLDPATAITELSATYIDEATSIALVGDTSAMGWWDLSFENMLNDQIFSAGTGFLCNFASAGVSLTFSGEVLDGATVVDLSGLQFPMISNFTPVDLTLGDLVATGMVPGDDIVQFLSTETAVTEVSATYIDEATSIALVGDNSAMGWWDLSFENSLNAQPFPAGSAVLGNFASASVTITFPDAIQ